MPKHRMSPRDLSEIWSGPLTVEITDVGTHTVTLPGQNNLASIVSHAHTALTNRSRRIKSYFNAPWAIIRFDRLKSYLKVREIKTGSQLR